MSEEFVRFGYFKNSNYFQIQIPNLIQFKPLNYFFHRSIEQRINWFVEMDKFEYLPFDSIMDYDEENNCLLYNFMKFQFAEIFFEKYSSKQLENLLFNYIDDYDSVSTIGCKQIGNVDEEYKYAYLNWGRSIRTSVELVRVFYPSSFFAQNLFRSGDISTSKHWEFCNFDLSENYISSPVLKGTVEDAARLRKRLRDKFDVILLSQNVLIDKSGELNDEVLLQQYIKAKHNLDKKEF